MSTTWKARVVMFSAWKAKMATRVRRSAITVTGWKTGRKRVANHSAPFLPMRTWRLREPAATLTPGTGQVINQRVAATPPPSLDQPGEATFNFEGEPVHAVVKVILETCLLTDNEKVKACQIAERAGALFVKTSTATQPGGATVEDIRLMRATVGPQVVVKASGYVTDVDKALALKGVVFDSQARTAAAASSCGPNQPRIFLRMGPAVNSFQPFW